MKLKARICPKGCRSGKRRRAFMQIVTNHVKIRYVNHQLRHDIELDWYCPLCDYHEPVNAKDIRDECRPKRASAGATLREDYHMEEVHS